MIFKDFKDFSVPNEIVWLWNSQCGMMWITGKT
jgi:hypothetical protein